MRIFILNGVDTSRLSLQSKDWPRDIEAMLKQNQEKFLKHYPYTKSLTDGSNNELMVNNISFLEDKNLLNNERNQGEFFVVITDQNGKDISVYKTYLLQNPQQTDYNIYIFPDFSEIRVTFSFMTTISSQSFIYCTGCKSGSIATFARDENDMPYYVCHSDINIEGFSSDIKQSSNICQKENYNMNSAIVVDFETKKECNICFTPSDILYKLKCSEIGKNLCCLVCIVELIFALNA